MKQDFKSLCEANVRAHSRLIVTTGEDALAALRLCQERQAIREGDPGSVARAMAEAGLVTLPLVEDSYGIGVRRITVESDVASWYAVQTAPQMERKASAELRKLGHACRVPMRAYWRQTRRKDKHGKPVKVRAEVPLCTGYAFLGVSSSHPDWRIIRARDGVLDVVGIGGTPQRIRAVAKLYAIFAADEAGQFDEARDVPAWTPEAGRSVRVADGPFAGFIGQIKRARGDAVKIVIDGLFGGADVDVKKDQLEPV